MKFYLKSVARNLLEGLDDRVEEIAMFNFAIGKRKFSLNKKNIQTIGAQDISWIRVYIKGGNYYDFIASSLTYFITENNFIILVNNDAELIDTDYIAKLVRGMTAKNADMQKMTSDEALKEYWIKSREEMKEASLELEEFYSIASQQKLSRLNLQDTYKHGKNILEKQYILDLMTRQIIRENKNEILNLM